jgi:hypothetical protein
MLFQRTTYNGFGVHRESSMIFATNARRRVINGLECCFASKNHERFGDVVNPSHFAGYVARAFGPNRTAINFNRRTVFTAETRHLSPSAMIISTEPIHPRVLGIGTDSAT